MAEAGGAVTCRAGRSQVWFLPFASGEPRAHLGGAMCRSISCLSGLAVVGRGHSHPQSVPILHRSPSSSPSHRLSLSSALLVLVPLAPALSLHLPAHSPMVVDPRISCFGRLIIPHRGPWLSDTTSLSPYHTEACMCMGLSSSCIYYHYALPASPP